ncbi:MAG: tetratricopeptide repeat protein [Thiolinea sp.]
MKLFHFILSLLLLIPGSALALLDNSTSGDCSPVITGDDNTVELNCTNTDIPEAALDSLEKSLDKYFQEQLRLLSSTEGTKELIDKLRQQIKDWMQRYHELLASIEEDLLKEPDNVILKYAKQALEAGDFEDAAQLYKKSAKEREEHVELLDERIEDLQERREKGIDRAASDRFNAGRAYELSFQPILALQEYEKAYEHRPDHFEYAFQYAYVAQGQNQWQQAEKVYTKLIAGLRKVTGHDEQQLNQLTILLNNQANLVGDDTQRRGEAESLYDEALAIRRKLASENPQVYLPDVAATLNNLAALIMSDMQRRDEAEALYSEALLNYRQLAKDNPQVYLADVSVMLNNLAALIMPDMQRRDEAEALYNETLLNYRQLAKDNPQVYLSDVAMTLNNLAILLQSDPQRRDKAETLYDEALAIRRKLARDNPQVYLSDVAMTLNNQATLIDDDTQRRNEAETLYDEALTIRRQLARDNLQVYLPDLANTLGTFGMAYLGWELPEKARPLLKEATEMLSPLAMKLPTVFGDTQAYFLIGAIQTDPENIAFVCASMNEAAEVAQAEELKSVASGISNSCSETEQ